MKYEGGVAGAGLVGMVYKAPLEHIAQTWGRVCVCSITHISGTAHNYDNPPLSVCRSSIKKQPDSRPQFRRTWTWKNISLFNIIMSSEVEALENSSYHAYNKRHVSEERIWCQDPIGHVH